jgi:hypothetical protein
MSSTERHCPRSITDRKGHRRTVRCRSWNCPQCADAKRARIIAAVRETFVTGHGVLALRFRAQPDDQPDNIDAVWCRLRARLPGIRYLAVREPAPDGHLHAMIAYATGEELERNLQAAGATDINIEPARDPVSFADYMLDKRQDRTAPRIMHSRDLTKILNERTSHVEEEEPPRRAGGEEETPAQAEEHHRSGGEEESRIAPRTADDEAHAHHAHAESRLAALIEAARAAGREHGCCITFSFTISP